MLVIRAVDPSTTLDLFNETPPFTDMTQGHFEAFCKRRGLLAFAAEEDGMLAGYAVAESNPKEVHVLTLEGDTAACRFLFGRLVRVAGERDMSGWCPSDRQDVQEMFETTGFTRQFGDDFQGRPSYFYCWARNEP